MDYSIEVLFDNNEEFSSFLKNMIREFNNEHSVYHKEARKKAQYTL